VSIFNDITPSARAAELGLRANRVRKQTHLDVVPMLVVEGATDAEFFSAFCTQGSEQIFSAGTRTLVEQLLTHLKREPVEGCECVFLIDCDGYGKTVSLAEVQELLVTETCDLEADLVQMGVAARVARRFVTSDEIAAEMVSRACELAMMISVVRRAAHEVSVPMKLHGGRQFRLSDLSPIQLDAWEENLPTVNDVATVLGSELAWSDAEIAMVSNSLTHVRRDFANTCLGKDALDFLFRLLHREGRGEVRGWNSEHFHKVVFKAAEADDFDEWEVGRRLKAWEAATGHALLARPLDQTPCA
jgi:hypothetical protein